MRAFLQSMLAFFTLGICSMACKNDTPTPTATPTDVVLNVPQMH
jgi:hypothetical protein